MNRFKIDKLLSNCERVKDHSLKFDNEWSRFLIAKCDELIKLSQIIDSIAYRYTPNAETPINGFISCLKISTIYTDLLVGELDKRDKIDLNLVKLFKLIIAYAQRVQISYNNLLREQDEKENKSSLIVYSHQLLIKDTYDQIHTNEDVLPISLAYYPGFWLGKEIQRLLKFFNFLFAIAFKLPRSISSIYSSKNLGKYCFKAFKNATVFYPFSVWHQSEGFFVSKFANYCLNLPVPVKSVSLHIERQKRFRLTHTGDIIDFHKASKAEIDDYLSDVEEQERQFSTGLRHRNRGTVECRFSYIDSRESILKSVEKIKNRKENFSALKYHTVRKEIDSPKCNFTNQVKELNIFDCQLEQPEESKIFFAADKKKKNVKYTGPKYGDEESGGGCEFNKDKTIIVYLHGGGFFTQSPRSCEIWLRRVVQQLGGVPVLAVHYSLTVPFPVPLQELLDVYLWLLSGRESVKELIGFHPRRIVLNGDSAGGYYCIANLIAINELNKKIGLNNDALYHIPLPSAVVLEYPVLSMFSYSASRCLSVLEPLIAFHPLMLVLSLYGANAASNGDYKKIKNEKFLKIQDKNKHLFDLPEFRENIQEFKRLNADDNAPWYQCDYPTFKTRLEYISQFYDSNPIISPLNYKHFDELSSIKMYSLVGEYDFLADDSIELMSVCKSQTCLDLIEDIMHGYLYFENFSPASRESLLLTVKRLQEASGF